MKMLASSGGKVYYAAKNYTAGTLEASSYKLDLVPLN
jgi:hypothetical protein